MTSGDTTQETILAVAFVIESSLSVYQQWGLILRDYLTFILKRLADAYSGARMRIAFVTYGPGDMPHSPLLCKRFFVDHQLVFKEMKDSPGKLGFGQANTGGDKGMAALEAHVAALELFDIMHETCQTRKSRLASNFVIHVAAFPPDTSQYPQWNESSPLDRTTWDSLPSEYQKRNIIYNAIVLNGRIRQFSSLHSALQQSRTESKPWFSVRAPHMVLLTGIPTLEGPLIVRRERPSLITTESKTTPAKRAGDLDKTPESKRPRLSNNKPETSPPQAGGMGTAQQSHIEISQRSSHTQGAAQHTIAMLNSKMRALEDKIRGLETKISEARRVGNTQMVEGLSSEWKQQKEFQKRLYEVIQSSNAFQTAGGLANNKSTTVDPPPGQSDTSSSLHQKNGKEKPPSHPQILDHPQSSDGVDAANLPQFTPSTEAGEVAVNQVSRQMQGAAGQIAQSQNAVPSHFRSLQPVPNVQRGQQNANSLAVWQGQLLWNGLGSAGKKECRAKVVAMSQSAVECRADTWPSIMTLVPTPEPAVPLAELKEWINRLKPVICRFQPQPDPTDPTNEQYFRSLIQLLTTRRVFAVAAWTLPSGGQENNVLVFPVSNQVLLGAFFPVTGIPEMPKPQPTAVSSTGSFNLLAQLQRLPPEQREYLIGQLRQRHSMSAMPVSQPHVNTGFNTVGISLNGNSSMASTGVQQQGGYNGANDEITASQVMSSLGQAQGDNQLGYP